MKLTTKAYYGVRALANLADKHAVKSPVPLKTISQEENISGIYLEQIFNKLKNVGLVKSVRGPGGGYVLGKAPAETNVYEVVTVLEENMGLGRCFSKKGKEDICAKNGKCATQEVWEKVNNQIKDVLEGVSLEDIVNRTREIDPCN